MRFKKGYKTMKPDEFIEHIWEWLNDHEDPAIDVTYWNVQCRREFSDSGNEAKKDAT